MSRDIDNPGKPEGHHRTIADLLVAERDVNGGEHGGPEQSGIRAERSARASSQLAVECAATHSLEQFEHMLADARRLRAELRIKPYLALADVIASLEQRKRSAACGHLFRGVKQLPASQRPDLLVALAQQVRWLPPFDRPTLLRNVLSACRRSSSEERLPPLMAAAEQSAHLSGPEYRALCDKLLKAASEMEPAQAGVLLAAVGQRFHALPSNRILVAFDKMLAVAEMLPGEYILDAIDAMIWNVNRLRPSDQPAAYDRLLCIIEKLRDGARARSLQSVETEILRLPPSIQPAMLARCESIRRS